PTRSDRYTLSLHDALPISSRKNRRIADERQPRRMSGRLAVGVSGAGSNLRALAAAADRGELGGPIALVFADRDCPALAWAAEQGDRKSTRLNSSHVSISYA